jgi:hypothetical protein
LTADFLRWKLDKNRAFVPLNAGLEITIRLDSRLSKMEIRQKQGICAIKCSGEGLVSSGEEKMKTLDPGSSPG